MKKLLILFVNGFPFNTSEPFLESEYPLYAEYFEKTLIITSCRRKEKPTRQINGSNTEIIEDYTLSKDLLSVLEAIPYMLTDSMFYRELKDLLTSGKFSLKKLYDLVVFALCGNHRAMQAMRWLRKHPEYAPDVLYAYWLHVPAYAALRLKAMLKGKPFTVSRAHGYDLYLERHETGYIPFHRQMYEKLDELAVISRQGMEYLRDLYGFSEHVSVHHLGAADRCQRNPDGDRSVLRVVSCARTIPLKRLNRIVDALSEITDFPVAWTHIGDGPVQKELVNYAREKLPGNITVEFMGNISNDEVYALYSRQPFHVFANVSETEGVPVSIMEAMSFGIPVIATDVGGTGELIDPGANGWLLHKDFSNRDLGFALREMANLPEAAYQSMRQASRRKFEKEYCAESNYRFFLERLSKGLDIENSSI